MKKPGILILCPFYPPNLGGVEIHLQLLTDYLSRRNYQVFVLTYKPLVTRVENYKPYEKKKRVAIWRFWWFGRGWFDKLTPYPPLQFLYIVPGLLFCSLLWMMKNNQKIKVIHAHGFAAAFVARIIGLFFPQKRKIVSTHFIYKKLKPGSLYAGLFKWVFSGFDQILLIGKESGRELQALGLDPDKMKIFRHWLDPTKFLPQNKLKCRKKLGLPEAKLVVLFVGRLLRMKGIFRLLEAAKSLPKDIIFVLVGDGPDGKKLRSKAKGIENFFLIGRKPHSQVIDYLGACDFLILPSLAEEAQPMVIMEALTCGRPVVVTNKGAAKEMVDSNVGVIITPSRLNIRRAVLDFYRHPQKLRKMTIKARAFALKNFSDKNAKIITDSYR